MSYFNFPPKGRHSSGCSGYLIAGVLYVVLPLFFALFFNITDSYAETVETGCMQDLAGFELQCTANDIQISGVATKEDGAPDIDITDPCEQGGIFNPIANGFSI